MENVTKQMRDEFKQVLIKVIIQMNVSHNTPRKLMRNNDLLEYLGCSYSTIENLRNAGKIPYKKVMGTYYYSFEEVSRVFEQTMN